MIFDFKSQKSEVKMQVLEKIQYLLESLDIKVSLNFKVMRILKFKIRITLT